MRYAIIYPLLLVMASCQPKEPQEDPMDLERMALEEGEGQYIAENENEVQPQEILIIEKR